MADNGTVYGASGRESLSPADHATKSSSDPLTGKEPVIHPSPKSVGMLFNLLLNATKSGHGEHGYRERDFRSQEVSDDLQKAAEIKRQRRRDRNIRLVEGQ